VAYLKPPAFARKVLNPLAMTIGIGGTETPSVRTRNSGQTQRVPIFPVEVEGVKYAVSARGETDWVRNLRRNPDADLRSRAGSRPVHAVELPVDQRPPIIEAYRAKAGRTVSGYFTKLPSPDDHPVFRLEPRGA